MVRKIDRRTRGIILGLLTLGILFLILGLTGCGAFNEANNYKTPDPANNAQAHWIRLDTPSNYETVIWACVGKDAVFIGQSSGLTVSTFDPNCGATSQIVGVP